MSFKTDMDRIAAKIGANVDQLGRAVKIELFSSTIRDTRVKTGRLRGNWQTSEEAPAAGELERLDPTGDQATANVVSTVKGQSLSYLVNNLPYAEHIEELDGMVARNVRRVQRNVAKKAKELNR